MLKTYVLPFLTPMALERKKTNAHVNGSNRKELNNVQRENMVCGIKGGTSF